MEGDSEHNDVGDVGDHLVVALDFLDDSEGDNVDDDLGDHLVVAVAVFDDNEVIMLMIIMVTTWWLQ